MAQAASGLVTVTATNVGDKTTLQVTNSPSGTSNIASFMLQIKNGNFQSFTLQNGWMGKKTSPTTIAFFSSTPIMPSNSTTFTINTDQSTPDLVWTASDANNNQLGTGEIGAPPPTPQNQGGQGQQQNQQTNQPPPQPNPGILSESTFRIIPSTPAPGFDVRVVGQSFSASTPLDLYIGSQKIDTFSSDSNGNFVVTTTIPQTQQPGSADFVLKDQVNNQKTFTTSIEQTPQSRTTGTTTTIPLTVNVQPILHPGDTQEINGTADPGSTVTMSILDSTGTSITTFTATADKNGNYAVSRTIPIDRAFGKYTIAVSDEKDQVSKEYTIVTVHQISISTPQQEYNPGDTVVINGTSISNQPVSMVVTDPTGVQVFAKDVNVTADGNISTSYQVESSAITGTYIITASQGNDAVSLYIGVGVEPVAQLTATLNQLNYQLTDKPILDISGPPGATLNLVIIDPSDQEKFSDIVALGQDGIATYSFNLTSYTPGIYAVALTRGNDKVVTEFSVGLQTGCGQISIRTVKDTYFPGDSLLIFGNANPNCIIQLSLTDPNSQQVKTEQTFVGKSGLFSAFDFRIPDDGVPGTWRLDATSGIDHISSNINVRLETTMTIQLDKNPPIYARGDIVQISGSGVGQSADVLISILGSNSTLDTLQIQSTNRGDYSTEWVIPTAFVPGTFTIQVSSIVGKITTPITIQ
ncbi:MAG: hypothetical protein ACREBB_04185 [Nitrosotalea sp.]